MPFESFIRTEPLSFFLLIICIVTTVAKYHSHTILVIYTMVIKHPSHNLGRPHHSAKYQFMSLATVIMVPSIIDSSDSKRRFC